LVFPQDEERNLTIGLTLHWAIKEGNEDSMGTGKKGGPLTKSK